MTDILTRLSASLALATALAGALQAQAPGSVDLTPTPPAHVVYPLFTDTSPTIGGVQGEFADPGSGRGQALIDIVGPDPTDPLNPNRVGAPDGILDIIQVNSNTPALPLGADPEDWITIPVGAEHFPSVVWRGLADGTFVDVTRLMSPLDPDGFNLEYPGGSPWGVVAGDGDGDGDPDLYFPCGGFNIASPNTMLRNEGDGTFRNISSQAGFGEVQASFAASWFDYDLDGDLDLFEGNAGIVLPTFFQGDAPDPSDRLYQNDGTGAMTDVGAAAGVNLAGNAFSTATADLNGDGLTDIVLSCFRQYNKIYYNNGDGTFRFMAPQENSAVNLTLADLEPDHGFPGTVDFDSVPAGFGAELPLEGIWSMPVEVVDFNGDGWQDIVYGAWSMQLPDMNPSSAAGATFSPFERTRLYLNKGDQDGDGLADGFFREAATELGIDHIGGCMGHITGDWNGDGFADLYVGGGGPQLMAHFEEDYLYINDGTAWPSDFTADPDQPLSQVFHEVGALSGTYANTFMAHGLTASFDSSLRRMHVIVGNGGPALFDSGQTNVFWNTTGLSDASSPGFLEVELEPVGTPLGAYGAVVEVVRDRATGPNGLGRTWTRERRSGRAFASHDESALTFGLGDGGALWTSVRWPNGVEQGRLLWPSTSTPSVSMQQPTLSMALDVAYPAEGGVELSGVLEETGAGASGGSLFFVSLKESVPGVFLPQLFVLVNPAQVLNPNTPLSLSGSFPSLPSGLYALLLVEFGTDNILGGAAVWHEASLATSTLVPAGPGTGAVEPDAPRWGSDWKPSDESPPLARAHVSVGRELRLQAEALRVAPARQGAVWKRISLAGVGSLALAGGDRISWDEGALLFESTRPGSPATLSFNDGSPLLNVGRSASCCDARDITHGEQLRFEGISGALSVDGRRFDERGVRRLQQAD